VGEEEEEEGKKMRGERRRVMAPCLLPFLRNMSSSPSLLAVVDSSEIEVS